MARNVERRGFWLAFAPLAALAALPLWTGDFPPLADLPQHAAQVSILRHWRDAACGYPQIYEIHWFTPYWLGYALAWALAALFDVVVAIRLVLTLVVVSLPLATRSLVRELGGDPWWALLCLPLAYGTPMSWGFFSFLVSAPLVVALLGAGFRYARAPGVGAGLRLGLACAALFLVHALALLLAGLLLGALVVAATPSLRQLPRRLAPLLLALPAPLAWWLLAAPTDRTQQARALYLGGARRLLELPVLLTGIPSGWLAVGATALVLGSLAVTRPTLARERARWVPVALLLALVLAAPNAFFGTDYLAPRCALFLFPALLCALDRGTAGASLGWRRLQIAGVTSILLVAVQVRFSGMAVEGAGLAALLRSAPAGGHLLYLDYDRQSRFSAEPAFLHSGALYSVDRCGIAEKSFARNFQLPVRYRPGVARPLPRLIEYMPYRFRWEEHGGDFFDLFLVRSAGAPATAKIAGGEGRLTLLARQGRWWLYANASRPAPGAPGSGREP